MNENHRKREKHQSVKCTLAGVSYVIWATILWSSVPICVKFALAALDAYTICWLRFAVGAAILLAIQLLSKQDYRIPKQHIALIAIGALGIGGNYVMYIRGIQSTTASAANVVVQFEVVSLVLLGHLVLKEELTSAKIAGMVITFSGVAVALWNGENLYALLSSENFFGNLLILIAAPLWAVYGIVQKILADRGFGVLLSLTHMFLLASVITLPVAAAGFDIHGPFSSSVIVALIVVCVFGTALAYVMIGKGLEILDASTAGVITCLLPIFTILNARIFLREEVSPLLGLGVVLVVLGIFITGLAEAQNQTPKNRSHPSEFNR
ncbi:MAG: DMT family transporter [Armatimonadota bacterium]